MARPRKFDDEALIDRAIDLFWRDGSDAVSIRDLESALELRAPSIYRRFHSKDQLLGRCVDRYVDNEVAGRVRRFLDDGDEADDPLRGLHSFFTSALQYHGGEERLRGCLLTTTAAHLDTTSPQVRDAVQRGFRFIETAFRKQLQRAIAADRLDDDTDADMAAKALLLSFQGLLVLARSGAPDLRPHIDATFDSILTSSWRVNAACPPIQGQPLRSSQLASQHQRRSGTVG